MSCGSDGAWCGWSWRPRVPMFGVGVGAVAMARVASGPGGATRACVRCGLYLISEDDQVRLALLFREANPHSGKNEATVEVLCADFGPRRGRAGRDPRA